MSGLEIIGVALAVIPLVPLVIPALEYCCDAVRDPIKTCEIKDLISCLKDQKALFLMDIRTLLRNAKVKDNIDGLSETECIEALQIAENETQMENYLGQELHSSFLRILDRYSRCVKSIITRLGRIHRPSGVAKENLAAILAAYPPKKSAFNPKERVSYLLRKRKLKKLIEDLEGLSLQPIITRKTQQQQGYATRQPSGDAEKLARIFAQVRTNVMPLLAAMCAIRTCDDDCSSRHKVLMRLDNRMPLQKQLPTIESTFKLAFALKDDLQEALVKVSQFGVGDRGVNGDSERLTDICHHAHRAQDSRCILNLRLIEDGISLLKESPESRRDFSDSEPKTLDDFLRKRACNGNMQISFAQRTSLALDIAASILQLRQTSWFSLPVNSRDIKFAIQYEEETDVTIPGLFVEQTIGKNRSTLTNGPKDHNANTALLELAILLLEIWHDRSLETWANKPVESEADRSHQASCIA
ncbi:hypothetical protein F4819DRAFT_486887 [Hypoxylon fuscum]|nr:hypothetical protein F4819DRAFT_486887 [Hypoxylon fuscum]